METISEHAAFNGIQGFYRHHSVETGVPMRFSAFLPPQAKKSSVPAIFCLAGLTCTEETFMTKAGAQGYATQHGVALIAPDTSPRGTGIAGEADDWDFGQGAGFYVDATEAPWNANYRMYSYILELVRFVQMHLPIDGSRLSITGHSMGGHGALVLALRNPNLFKAVSAFAPICAPTKCAWGVKAFSRYLGADKEVWRSYDASELMSHRNRPFANGILIDQGLDDKFLTDQLRPDSFINACSVANQKILMRRHPMYDHSYYFISTFIEQHIRFHAQELYRVPQDLF
jgi:S-formylglutathione hydrolase